MKKVIAFILYATIFFSIVFGGTGTLRIGPFSLRHLCTVILILYSIWQYISEPRISSAILTPLKYYLIYLAIYTLANVFNGEIISFHFIQSFVTYHIPCLAILLSFPLIIRDEQSLALMTYAIISIYLFNAIITILQYVGNPVAWEIGRMIAEVKEDDIEALETISSNQEDLFGFSLASGIIGFVVTNGYIIASFFPLLTRHLYRKINFSWLLDLLFIAIGVFAAFAIQQRSAFFLIAVYLVLMVAWKSNILIKALLFCSLIFMLSNSDLLFSAESLGRIQQVNEGINNRGVLLSNFNNFLNTPYAIFGGYDTYTEHFGMSPHNTILSAWTIGGVFNAVYFTIFFIYLIIKIIREHIISLGFPSGESYILVYSSASGIFLLYSFFHSAGVQNGSPMFWIVFTLLLISTQIQDDGVYEEIEDYQDYDTQTY